MIESNSNKLEVIGEARHSIKQSNSSQKKSNFNKMVVTSSIFSSRYIPFRGCLNVLFSKSMDESTVVYPKTISNKTTVVTLCHSHSAILIGGG